MLRRVIRMAIIVWSIGAAVRWARRNGVSLGSHIDRFVGGRPTPARRPRTNEAARAALAETASREATSARRVSSTETAASTPDEPDAAATSQGPESTAPEGDDLKVIEGIGPRIDEVLHEAGVTSFAQLADLTPEAIASIVNEAGVHASPGTWPDQARLAARGEWDALAEWQAHLKGGREVTAD